MHRFYVLMSSTTDRAAATISRIIANMLTKLKTKVVRTRSVRVRIEQAFDAKESQKPYLRKT